MLPFSNQARKIVNACPSCSMRRVQQIRIIIIDRPLIHPLFPPPRENEPPQSGSL